MFSNESMAWLKAAAGGIRYPPDRKRAERELYAHMTDRNRDFMDTGCSEREADEKVLAAMGDALEVRRALAAVHRPFWGYVFLILRLLVLGAFLWALIAGLLNSRMLRYAFSPLTDEERFAVSQWEPQSGKARCGEYTFRLKRSAFALEQDTGEECLLLELSAFTADPFLGEPELGYSPGQPFRVEDSLGQVYPVRFVGSRELVFTSRWLFAVDGLDRNAEWAVLTMDMPLGPMAFALRLEGERR